MVVGWYPIDAAQSRCGGDSSTACDSRECGMWKQNLDQKISLLLGKCGTPLFSLKLYTLKLDDHDTCGLCAMREAISPDMLRWRLFST